MSYRAAGSISSPRSSAAAGLSPHAPPAAAPTARYCTRIGDGPRHLTSSDPAACLVDPKTGYPRPLTDAEENGHKVRATAVAEAPGGDGAAAAAVAGLAAQSAAQHREVMGALSSSWAEDLAKVTT